MIVKGLLIINSKIGQLGNTLLLSSHVMACAIEHNLVVINIPLDEYARYFSSSKYNLLCSYPSLSFAFLPPNIMARLMIRGRTNYLIKQGVELLRKFDFFDTYCKNYIFNIQINGHEEVDLSSTSFVNTISDQHFVCLTGWRFRAPSYVNRHADKIRSYFKPTRRYTKIIESFASGLKRKCDILVGIHIRQGDYKKWRGGEILL